MTTSRLGKKKASQASEATSLEHLPNVGRATIADLRLLGIDEPKQLVGRDPYQMYDELCRMTNAKHDPCVIDLFISIVRFMEGAPPKVWWDYTPERKRRLAEEEAKTKPPKR